ncbi:hypothetical protein [Marasmitruncus massiliensis]|uniref:hypothetical protein n=1 Tax=Marasmitruncus massiliensis TaxID=1944642 RepID=UPI000C79F938|nr:hypothetical protein [Marasmitruncus massiliensis]
MGFEVKELNNFGAPFLKRKSEIRKKCDETKTSHYVEFMGEYRALPVIEVRIEFAVYRLANGRTRPFQQEYLVKNPDIERDIFIKDHDSIDAQYAQHEILKQLVEEEGLLKAFRSDNLHQTEPIISTNSGVVVNGNRRLCAWRELYYSDRIKYKHFETIKMAILPECDERAIRDLEKRLQVQNSMRAEYRWHAIALMASEDIAQGIPSKDVAESLDKSVQAMNLLIECREYAETYLKKKGHPDEWSLVDKDYYAFEKIVKGRKRLDTSGEKELFETLSFAFVEGSKDDGRLYEVIPNIAENLNKIAQGLEEKLNITPTTLQTEEISLLADPGDIPIDKPAIVASVIKNSNNLDLVRKITTNIITTQQQIKQERDAGNFLLNQVSKAASLLTEAATIGLDASDINTQGVAKHLKTIQQKVNIILAWLNNLNEN